MMGQYLFECWSVNRQKFVFLLFETFSLTLAGGVCFSMRVISPEGEKSAGTTEHSYISEKKKKNKYQLEIWLSQLSPSSSTAVYFQKYPQHKAVFLHKGIASIEGSSGLVSSTWMLREKHIVWNSHIFNFLSRNNRH